MAQGGPYKPWSPPEDDWTHPADRGASRDVTGFTDAEISQQAGEFGQSYDPNSGMPGIMSQDRAVIDQRTTIPDAPPSASADPVIRAAEQQTGPLGGSGGTDFGTPGASSEPAPAGTDGRGRRVRFAEAGARRPWDPFPDRRSDLLGHTTQVGKYGGAPIFGADTGLLPLGVIDSKLRTIEDEQEKLLQQAKQLNLNKDFEKLNRPEYEDKYNQWKADETNAFYEKVKQFWGGDDIKASADLADPSSPFHRQFFGPGGIVESVNTVARLDNQLTDEAMKVVKGMDERTLQYDPVMYRKSKDLLEGTGDFAHRDPRQLAKAHMNYLAVTDADKYIKDNEVVKNMLAAADINVEGPTARRDRTGAIIVSALQKKQWDSVVDGYAKGIAKQYEGRSKDLNAEYFKKKLGGMVPVVQEKVDFQVRMPPTGGAESKRPQYGNGTATSPTISAAYTEAPLKMAVTTPNEQGQSFIPGNVPKELLSGTVNVPQIALGLKGKSLPANVYRSDSNEKGAPLVMYPTGYAQVDGRWYIVGKETSSVTKEVSNQRTESTGFNSEGGQFSTTEGVDMSSKEFKSMKDVMVPVDVNEDKIKTFIGPEWLPDELMGKWGKNGVVRGGQSAFSRTQVAPFKEPTMVDAKPMTQGAIDAGVDQALWDEMTEEERAAFQ